MATARVLRAGRPDSPAASEPCSVRLPLVDRRRDLLVAPTASVKSPLTVLPLTSPASRVALFLGRSLPVMAIGLTVSLVSFRGVKN